MTSTATSSLPRGESRPGLDRLDEVVAEVLAAARKFPSRVAVRDNGSDLTYEALGSAFLATARELGPEPGAVGVSLPRSSEAIVAILGVFAAGGTYCPIDPAAPTDRQRALIAATGCRSVIGTHGISVIHHDVPSPREPVDRDVAYVLCTSGSTGVPKPVLTPRLAIGTSVAALRDLFAITPTDSVLHFASLNWDTCFEEILPTLTTGATLVIDRMSHSGSVPALLRLVAAEGITVMNLPTAYWHTLVAHLVQSGGTLPSAVRLVVIGGEAASPARLADWHDRGMSAARLLNTYGSTETTLITHAAELDGNSGSAPIGRPLSHVIDHVTDEGELLVAGPSLACGYRGLDDQTNQRFRLHDFGDGPMRFFHTGDRVERTSDGMLHHRGRLDAEIKIRGIRVDPAEVEFEISRHPAVASVAVAGLTVADHTSLVAYVMPQAGADASTLSSQLVTFLRGRVAAHLVPSRITVVDVLPQTTSGKVDRAAVRAAHSTTNEPSRRLSVGNVVQIFRRILETEEVAPDSDFFDAGGDSLLATRVLSLIAHETGVELSFDDFVQASSPAELAELTASA
jgi:amino acid adenylation domain-containing protein